MIAVARPLHKRVESEQCRINCAVSQVHLFPRRMPVCTAKSTFNKSTWPLQSVLRHFNVEDVRAKKCTVRDDEFPGERMGFGFERSWTVNWELV